MLLLSCRCGQDFDSSCIAYDQAIRLESDYLTHLNYAITLFLNDEIERSAEHYKIFDHLFQQVRAAQPGG
jgi:Bardet-Biedl syndrome 4 protein